jgi:hypothetical protein
MRSIRRFEMVELIIPALATATRFNFPDIPQLRSDVTKDIVVRGIELYSVESIPLSFNNNAVSLLLNIQRSSLTLYIEGEESVFRIPLIKMMNINSNNAAAPVLWFDEINQFDNLQVDWTKSYISTPVAYGNAALFAFVLGITYKRYAPGTMKRIKDEMGLNPGCDAPQMM